MNCEEARQQMIAASYVAGRLSDAERDEFEEHYFGCDRCFAEVEALRAVKQALPEAARTARVSAWVWALPLAAALLLALFLWPRRQPEPLREAAVTAVQDYTALARFDPPAWNPIRLRGRETPAKAAFEKAMSHYSTHDYGTAAQALHSIDLPEAHYYEGICLLLTGNADKGSAALKRAINSGDTPYLEEARFYLAKALLARNDAAAARDQLRLVAEMQGDLEQQAKDLIGKLK